MSVSVVHAHASHTPICNSPEQAVVCGVVFNPRRPIRVVRGHVHADSITTAVVNLRPFRHKTIPFVPYSPLIFGARRS